MQLTPVALTLVCFEQTKVEVSREGEKKEEGKGAFIIYILQQNI
jgi:hypothetical protein